MQSNQTNRIRKMEKIMSSFINMQKLPKALIKAGIYVFLAIYFIGTILVILNNTILQYDPYFDMVSKEIVKTSFKLAAEAIIGSLIMDFVFKK